jgi:sec-independent protein translocase protein TatA
MPNIGPLEIIIVLVIVLVIFGPKRLPDLGRSLGRGMREFKDSVTGKDQDDDERPAELADPDARVTATSPHEQEREPAKPAGDTTS